MFTFVFYFKIYFIFIFIGLDTGMLRFESHINNGQISNLYLIRIHTQNNYNTKKKKSNT